MTKQVRSTILRYSLAAGAFAGLLGLAAALRYFQYSVDLTIPIIASLIAIAWYAGRGPGILLSVLLVLATIWRSAPSAQMSRAGLAVAYLTVLGILILIVWLVSGRKNTIRHNADLRKQVGLLLESVGEGIIGIDNDGRCTFVNPAALRMVGWERDEMIGRHQHETLHHSRADGSPYSFEDCPIRASLQNGSVRNVKNEVFWRKDGTSFPLEYTSTPIREAGKLTGAVVVFRDTTDQVRAQSALLDSEKRYRYLFESSPLPMWVYDRETLKFLAVNKASCTHYGYTREEFMSLTIKDIRPADGLPAFLANVSAEHAALDPPDIWKHRKKDGTIIDAMVTSHELEFARRPARLVLAQDVTESVRAEAAIKRLNATLERRVEERTAKLEAANRELEAFSYSVSHDLRAPLRAIDGFSRIFIEDYGDKLDEEGRRVLDVIRTNAQNMGQLIDDLLTFSRLGRKEIELVPVNMTDLANSVGMELANEEALKKPCSIKVDDLPNIMGDRALIRQVFINLLSNAVKYSSKKEITDILVGSRIENGENVYFVRDRGVGFDMRYADKLFGVFQRLHSPDEFEGTGVGLAIVQRVVARHGGRVWADAEVDKGATFYFSMPANGQA